MSVFAKLYRDLDGETDCQLTDGGRDRDVASVFVPDEIAHFEAASRGVDVVRGVLLEWKEERDNKELL